ncbi:MAG: hypothetical protein QXX99_00115 [Candidatus Bathyarchaeia archaeon]
MPKNSSPVVYTFLRRLAKLTEHERLSQILVVILLIATIFLIGGGIYITFMPREVVTAYYRGLIMVYPGLYDQTLAEGAAVILTYALGTAGLMLIYRSARFRHNPGRASLLIKIGVILLIVSIIMIEAILFYKI